MTRSALGTVSSARGEKVVTSAPCARCSGPSSSVPATSGSLTTPPCAEKVRWHLMLTPKQMRALSKGK